MLKIKMISLQDWFLIAPGVFLMGLSLGLVFSGINCAIWVFVIGFLIETPALIALKRHK